MRSAERPLEPEKKPRRSEIMRSSFLILVGAVAGATLTLTTTQSGLYSTAHGPKPQSEDGARQLKLFRGVFERVRADYVDHYYAHQ